MKNKEIRENDQKKWPRKIIKFRWTFSFPSSFSFHIGGWLVWKASFSLPHSFGLFSIWIDTLAYMEMGFEASHSPTLGLNHQKSSVKKCSATSVTSRAATFWSRHEIFSQRRRACGHITCAYLPGLFFSSPLCVCAVSTWPRLLEGLNVNWNDFVFSIWNMKTINKKNLTFVGYSVLGLWTKLEEKYIYVDSSGSRIKNRRWIMTLASI